MEEDKLLDLDTSLRIAAQVRLEKQHYERELRGLEIRAYSGVLEALRASGKPNGEKEGVIKTLRDYFNISEDRHKAEIRLMAFDSQLSRISKKVKWKKLNGYDFTEEWAFQAQRVYVPLGSQAFSICKPRAGTSKQLVVRDPAPTGRYEDQGSTDSDSFSESELEVLDSLIENSKANGWHPGKHKTLTEPIAVDVGTGNENEIEEIEQTKKNVKSLSKKQQCPPKSPDITDVPRTQLKSVSQDETKLITTHGRRRGVKRKKIEEFVNPPPPPLENSAKLTAKKLAEKSKNIIKSSTRPKVPKVPSRRSESKKVKESSSETSSADEGENGPMPPDESSRVMSPVFSEVIRTSVLARGKARGGRGRNSSIDKRRNNILNSSSATKTGKSRPRTPNQKSAKFKISTPTSGSRRKSKLNEKIDYDEVLMDLDGNEMGKQRLPAQIPIPGEEASRRLLFDNQTYDREDYKASEDCAVYTESLPVNYHEDMEQVTDGVFKRPLPPSKGPKPWEIKDARLNHYHQSQRTESICDENTDGNINLMGNDGVQQQRSTQAFSPPQINSLNVNDLASPTTSPKLTDSPPSKKQRIKSPLVVNPNINSSTNKVPLPPPVFTTSLSSVNKKRNNNNNKPISVVDSLNLHLPTSATATASSLAASSSNRRPGTATGGGCSMFSNSSALIAGARNQPPGILQQQRKAQPHILSNSKVQRSFLPVVNSNIATNNNNVANNIVPIGGAPISIAGPPSTMSTPVAASGHTVQLAASPIPISSMSSANPSSPLPFQSFPGSPPPGINISGGMPVGHLSRSASGTNIIFVQKANGPTVSGDSDVPSNVVPIKTQPRAVILRRAQLPRQGNVMILDMQKNQLVSPVPGQAPPFLQTARVLNAPGELSLVNIQPSTSIRKSSPPMSLATTTTQVLNNISSIYAPQQIHQLQIQDSGETNPESFVTLTQAPSQITPKSNSSIVNTPVQIATTGVAYHQVHTQENESISISSSNAESGNDAGAPEGGNQDAQAQYAQIEAELMQMEQENFGEVVYEEEVTTEIVPLEHNETTQYIYASETCANADGEIFLLPQEPSSHNVSSTSGSSTDTAPESETSFQNFESSENDPSRPVPITKVTLSPGGEVKMASEAISRALSLSKSSAKRLTFTTPISLSTAATLAETLANSNKSNSVPDTVVTTNSTQLSIVPSIFQATTTDLNPTAVVIKGDSSSTNSVHIGNSQPGIEFTLHNNEILQQP